ncbi:MAG: DJ-1/PfpI family protein [Ignavibacteria bacterium]|nr:DJ-1/PfpI family protein [Ignavibacteria bacterium]
MEKQIKVLVIIADGTEDIEATVPIDLFRRANFEVVVAGNKQTITFARGLKVIPDRLLAQIPLEENFDLIYIPGGAKGVENLINTQLVGTFLQNQKDKNQWISAICAGPLVLDSFNILSNADTITSHPLVKDKLLKYNYREEEVVVSGKIVTSRGAGTSIPFALKIIELLANKELSNKIASDIVYWR